MKVLVVIPVYNHAATVRAVAEAALAAGHAVLVVDDGSTDGSLAATDGLELQRLRLARNRGKGQAILQAAGWAQAAGFEAILTLDADGQHDPADAQLLLAEAGRVWPAILIGARRMETANVPRSSLFGRAFSNFWVRLECGQSLADTQSGYRMYPVEFLLSRRFLTRRYTFEIEALVRGVWAGLPVASVPVSVRYAPGAERISHFRMFRDNLRLTGLHTALVVRSLLPWPHSRLVPWPHSRLVPWPHSRLVPKAVEPAQASGLAALAHPLRCLRAMSREHSSPAALAAAVWMGIFLGSLPIIPFGLVTILYVNQRLHLNKLAGAAASNLCVAPFVPFLCIQTGHFLLHGRWWSQFNRVTLLQQAHHRLGEWLLGAMLVGPLLGALGAALAYVLIRAYRQDEPAS